MPYFVQENGAAAGQRYPLVGETVRIGRHPDCELRIEDAGRTSRYHAMVVSENGVWSVKDLNSRNGTLVNRVPIGEQARRLADGDQVCVGDIELVYRDGDLSVSEDSPSGRVAVAVPIAQGDVSLAAAIVVDDSVAASEDSAIVSVDSPSIAGGKSSRANDDRRLSAVIEIQRSLGRSLTLDEVLASLQKGLFEVFLQADFVGVMLFNDRGELIPHSGNARGGRPAETRHVSRPIIRSVIEKQEVVLTADAVNGPSLGEFHTVSEMRIRATMVAPLVDSAGTSLGVVLLDTLDQRRRFQREDLAVFAAAAAVAGMTIERAWVHEATLRQSKLEQELKLCYAYQGALIPSAPPRLNGYRVRDWLDVGSPLAGDYYDYIPLADGRLAVFLADVAGKGIEAVMAVARLSAQVHYWLPQPVGPAEVMTRINDDVCERGDRFIAALLVVLRPDSHTVAVVNAGHTPPIWRQSKSAIETPGRTLSGLPLGVQAGQVYQSEEIILAPGDLLLLSTDGLAQTLNGREERFTFERLLDCVRQEPSGLDEVIYRISRAVREHQGGAKRGDDQCVVGLQRE